jgi:hypothetical protein
MSQINLADAWKIIDLSLNNNTGMRSMPSKKIGLLQLLASAANKNASRVKLGDVQTMDRGNGKVYKVTRRFFPRLGQLAEDSFEYCPTGGQGVNILSDEVEITNETKSKRVVIDDELLRCIKEGKADYQNSYVNEVLRNHINNLGAQVSAKVAKENYIGSFVKCDCNDAPVFQKNLPLFLANGLSINPVGESILDIDAKEAELDQSMILVGGTLLSQYSKAREIASGNELGFNAGLLDITSAVYYDTHLSASLGDPDAVIAMAPGALQIVTYSKHKDQFMKQFDTQLRETVIDPWLGLEHDVIVSYEICGDEVKMYIQFRTTWAVVGMPKCWAAEDCLFDGVTDVFSYKVVCADTGYCDIPPACGIEAAPQPSTATFCNSTVECNVPCKALFYSRKITGELFTGSEIDVEDATAIQINGLPIILGGTFDLSTESGANAYIAAVAAALANLGYIYAVSGGWDGVGLTIKVFASDVVTSVVIVSDAGSDVSLDVETAELINIFSASTATTGANITDLDWTLDGPVNFNGAPNDLIVDPNAVGTYGNFYTEISGSVQLIITDSVDCTDTYTATV